MLRPLTFTGAEIKIAATKCQILRRKFTQYDFGGGSAQDSAGGVYSAPQTPSWI